MNHGTTDRKPVNTGKGFQLDTGSSSNINAPIYSIAAHRKTEGINPAHPAVNLSNNRFNNSIFDNATVKTYYAEIDGVRYPKDPIILNTKKIVV